MEEKFFHILNRGVDKKEIFNGEEDYIRFTNNLVGLNNKNIASPYCYRKKQFFYKNKSNYGNRITLVKIVNILCWCLMPNHFHSFIEEKFDKSAGWFSKKLISGHTHYFNLKNKRSGVLFQGRSKIIPIEQNEHFLWLPYYIMANPIKLIEPKWKENGIKNIDKVMRFLENYKYSSFPDLIGKTNFPEIINKKMFYEIYDTNEEKFKKDFMEWLSVQQM